MKPTRLTALLLLLAAVLCADACAPNLRVPSSGMPEIQTFRDIPGITAEEISAIEELQATRQSFSFGMMPTTESFTLQNDSYAGFSPLFSDLLSDLFGIRFVPEFHAWDSLYEGLLDHSIDFTGMLSPTPGRREIFYMSEPIAERSVVVFHERGAPIETTTDLNGLRLGFFTAAVTPHLIRDVYPSLKFEIIEVQNASEAVDKLSAGEIDAFVADAISAFLFIDYPLITSSNLLPLIYVPVSMSTADSALKPIISAVDKYLLADGTDRLYELYDQGTRAYERHVFSLSLTDEERAYITGLTGSGGAVPIALEHDNYPISFFNEREGEFQGVAWDILQAVTELTGINFEIAHGSNAPWNEILGMLTDGRVKLISELLKTDERLPYFIWPENYYYTSHHVFISRLDYPDQEFRRVPRSRTGLVKGYAYEELYKSWFPDDERNYVMFDSQDEAFDALVNEKIDLLFTADYNLLYQTMYREKPGFKVNLTVEGMISHSYFGLNKNETALRSIIDKAQDVIDTDKIANNWMSRTFDYTTRMAEQRFIYMTVFSAILGLMLAALAVLFFRI
ncbi:MAG: transporter substrate-binding domain-containing protein, partial [Defluviitaleaceae bacterium]|nr:transporter substrate-binding domain-containing protein [Defluviitaleaceae bacterium]